MSVPNLGMCNARQAAKFIEEIIGAGRVPFLKSNPGAGKSSIIRKVAKKYNLKLIDHRLSTAAQEDMTGLPEFYTNKQGNRRARFAPFDEIFPLEDNEIPEGYSGWLVFFDEFNSGNEQLQAASYKVILDRLIGQTPLHQNVAMVCAGNLDTDRAITTQMSTAMQSRLTTLELYVDFDIWLQDVALPNNYDDRIVAFLSSMPDRLMDFRPDHNDKTFCCPR